MKQNGHEIGPNDRPIAAGVMCKCSVSNFCPAHGPPRVVEMTPNGREIRLAGDGKYEVQPHNDQYWVRCDTVEDARAAYHDPAKYRTPQ